MPSDPDSPQIVADRLTELEAAAIANRLTEQGIEAHLWGAQLSSIYGEVATRQCMQIAVRHSDAERAAAIVEEFLN